MSHPPPIEARGLRKRYGDTFALDGFDLDVSAGSVHALLGPNGAGKSTAVHTFATLTRIDEGEARVAGFDVRTEHAQVRSVIGLVGQSAALDEILHGRENLVMFARLHGLDPAEAQRAEYGFLTDTARQRAVLLKPGTMLLQQPHLPIPLEVTFPRPGRPVRALAGSVHACPLVR